MMYSYDLPNAIEILKKINLQHRTLNAKNRELFTPPIWAKQFCTVSVNPGRQTGKSWYCDMSCDESGVIIVPSKFNSKDRANTFSCTSYKSIDRKLVKYVYIEEPSFISNLDELYVFFTRDGIERTFILIGE